MFTMHATGTYKIIHTCVPSHLLFIGQYTKDVVVLVVVSAVNLYHLSVCCQLFSLLSQYVILPSKSSCENRGLRRSC